MTDYLDLLLGQPQALAEQLKQLEEQGVPPLVEEGGGQLALSLPEQPPPLRRWLAAAGDLSPGFFQKITQEEALLPGGQGREPGLSRLLRAVLEGERPLPSAPPSQGMRERRELTPPLSPLSQSGAREGAMGVRDIDRAFQRDSRRYDNGFF